MNSKKWTTRPARQEDCRAIAELYRISSDGVADYVWSKIASPGEDLLDVGERRYRREGTAFSYQNAVLVEIDNAIAGMLVAFPMVIDPGYIEDDPVLTPYSRLEEPDSLYICSMAVFAEHRGMGIGHQLLDLARQQASDLGLPKLSLIVFEENAGAKRLYERHGFAETARQAVVPHELIHHEGDAILMVRTL